MAEREGESESTLESSASGLAGKYPLPQPATAAAADEQPASLLPKLLDAIKLAGAAYAIGFAVIMVHTARLGGPVVEAFEFQNIVAGLPVWALLLLALYLWPYLVQPFRARQSGQAPINRKLLLRIAAGLVFYIPAIYLSAQAIVQLLGHPSLSEKIILFFTICFSASLLLLVSWYKNPSSLALLNVSFLLSIYSGLAFLVVCYAILLYPRVPQSIGGGHPVKVKLLLKDKPVVALFEASDQTSTSSSVDLFYRTGSFLLVSRGPGQPLVQLPMSDINAIIYVDSKAN